MQNQELEYKKKKLGQVFTPQNIVIGMLDNIGYVDSDAILHKHIIDNSCGQGAFLVEIVDRYIRCHINKYNDTRELKQQLQEYIHGIEIDKDNCVKCIYNLDKVALLYGLVGVEWDIKCANTLDIDDYNGLMDYCVGNPPYVRVHNLLDNFNKVKQYAFANQGMTDLYIVFFEIGFRMLNDKGKLAYISPSSYFSSVAGRVFRQYILDTISLYRLVNLKHSKPFKVSTYLAISFFDKTHRKSSFEYNTYKDDKYIFEYNYSLDELDINSWVFCDNAQEGQYHQIKNYKSKLKSVLQVKNAFATLADKVFINKDIVVDTIDIIKASTGEWKKCIYPYDKQARLIDIKDLSKTTKQYLQEHKAILQRRSLSKTTAWYAFGRSQAISDVYKDKYCINTTIKDIKSIKLNKVASGQGVYSGLYILTTVGFDRLEQTIKNQNFIDYITTLGKYKSGGYYTFSSNDLQQYLLYQLEL